MTLREFYDEWNAPTSTILVHTSGSTGEPKPLLVEKRRMVASATMTCDFFGLRPGDTALLCMPLEYIAGKMMVVRAITRGMKLIDVEPSGHPMARLTDEQPIHLAAMVPLQVFNTLAVEEECERLKRVKHLIIGGGPLDERVEQQLNSFPNHVWATYGMTETLSHVAMRRVNGPEGTKWYTPMPGVKMETADDGCLVVKAPALCQDVLHTHDIVEWHPDGKRFKVVGRSDNIACSGGVKIQMEKVEEALRPYLKFPFFVAKTKDEKFGEILVLVTEGGDKQEIEDIFNHVLPPYWKPRKIVFVKVLPLTETGKPLRRVVLG
ncbi:MAG: AMP-binding protein [Prevotella sp.]|nr:AMP-binding protein [Prevotella sp.]